MLIEVLIRCRFEEMEIVDYFCEIATLTELLPQSINFVGLIWVGQSFHLSFLISILRGLAEDFLFISVVATLLILESIDPVRLGVVARLIGLELLHQLFCGADWLDFWIPYRFRLMHEWILLRHLQSFDNILFVKNVLVCIS